MKESVIENYLTRRVKAVGGEVRKVMWGGRLGAPDRLVMLPFAEGTPPRGKVTNVPPRPATVIFVELKNPDTIKTFPANAHERAQAREHRRLRRFGVRVEVIGTKEQVDELLR